MSGEVPGKGQGCCATPANTTMERKAQRGEDLLPLVLLQHAQPLCLRRAPPLLLRLSRALPGLPLPRCPLLRICPACAHRGSL